MLANILNNMLFDIDIPSEWRIFLLNNMSFLDKMIILDRKSNSSYYHFLNKKIIIKESLDNKDSFVESLSHELGHYVYYNIIDQEKINNIILNDLYTLNECYEDEIDIMLSILKTYNHISNDDRVFPIAITDGWALYNGRESIIGWSHDDQYCKCADEELISSEVFAEIFESIVMGNKTQMRVYNRLLNNSFREIKRIVKVIYNL